MAATSSSSSPTFRAKNAAVRQVKDDGGNPGGSPTAALAAADSVAEGGDGGQGKGGGVRAEVAAPPVTGGPRLGRLKGLGPGGCMDRAVGAEEAEEEEEEKVEDVEDFIADLQRGNEYLRAKEVGC